MTHFIRAGSQLSRMIGIALGVGILISALGGWPGGAMALSGGLRHPRQAESAMT
ncbi:MAG: hypothetical protein JXB07_00490 [Anaerolineae bacterium]|nr:hypothetical protein [Anaerolineae bacterium]